MTTMTESEALWVREHAWTDHLRTLTDWLQGCPCTRAHACWECEAGHHDRCAIEIQSRPSMWDLAGIVLLDGNHPRLSRHEHPFWEEPLWYWRDITVQHDGRCTCWKASHHGATGGAETMDDELGTMSLLTLLEAVAA